MRRTTIGLLLLLGSARAGDAPAYEPDPTHESMTRWALNLAAVAGYEELRAYEELIVMGSKEEDETPRFARHFWKPDQPANRNGLPKNWWTRLYMAEPTLDPLQTRYMDALTWATHGMDDDLDWHGAVDAYGYDHNARGRAYLALGHVVHLLQDMAQPDHAENRPHPGGHTHDEIAKISKTWAEVVAPTDRVAYEILWLYSRDTWPRGKVAIKPPSLEKAFRDLATESAKTERHLGLLHTQRGPGVPPEIALGLTVLTVENYNRLTRGIARAGFKLSTPRLQAAYKIQKLAKARDTQWADFESNIPLQPIIPWPPTAETEPYLKLGHKLIPLAEEHSAGLVQLYHDIVNHPPIVQAVVILQDGKEMCRKEWRDGPQGRALATVADTPLKQGAEAEIRVTFGPSRAAPALQEPIGNIRVALEGGDAIAGSVVSGSGEPVTWSGRVVVQKAGKLAISATDMHAHYEDRNHRGDALDADPSTYALAKAPAPFHWTGYEPGADRNHALNLGGGCGVCSALARHAATFVSGTLKGSVRALVQGRDGLLSDFRAQVTFRCIRVGYAWDRHEQKNAWICGVPKGRFEGRWRPDDRVPIENSSGTEFIGGASIEASERCDGTGHAFSLQLGPPRGSKLGFNAYARGKVADGLDLRGEGRDGDKTTTWDLKFEPAPAPEHVTATDIMNPGDLGSGIAGYIKQDWDAAIPAITALHVAGRAGDAKAIQDALTAAGDEWSAASDEWGRLQSAVLDAYADAEKGWVYMDPSEADAKYREALDKLRPAVGQFKRFKKTWEEKFAASSLRIAERIEGVNKDAAKKLREQAERLKSKGAEAFVDSH